MSTLDALRRAVDHFPGGRQVLALRVGKADEVLRKELAGSPTHKMGERDAVSLARMCVEAGSEHAYDYASIVAAECGGRFERMATAPTANSTPMAQVADLVREASDVTAAVLHALSNNRVEGVIDISDNQRVAIERELDQLLLQQQALRETVRAINLHGKPSSDPASSARVASAVRAALRA